MKRGVILILLMALGLTNVAIAQEQKVISAGVTRVLVNTIDSSLAKVNELSVEENEKVSVKAQKPPKKPKKKKVDKVLGHKDKRRKKYTESEINDICRFTNEELAKCVYAEAGNQSIYGKRLVCDTILNRVDDERFPENIHNVISQPNQYYVYKSGAMSSACPDEETYIVVYEELEERTNKEVLYFRTGHYFSWATPVVQEGAHYFSK